MGKLELRCQLINKLFEDLMSTNSRLEKETIVAAFREEHIEHVNLLADLDFCFMVLAGKYKLGYTYIITDAPCNVSDYDNCTIRDFYRGILMELSATQSDILLASAITPLEIRDFIEKLANRKFRLGYSDKENMVTFYSPMLAKKYQETFRNQYYYVQEKLDGNRCIAYYSYIESKWIFMSRSGKRLNVKFNMDWADDQIVYDGEIMTLEHAGTRDFNKTSGMINGLYTDKSQLHYYIYDIVEPNKTYEERKKILDSYNITGPDCDILPVLDKVWVNANHDYNCALDKWLDYITDKGGEGIMLRDPDGLYLCGKRSNGLLKYKKVQTMDLRIIDFNFGNGKYEGAIGSFYCESDDKAIRVNVSGMPDEMHFGNPADFMGKIVEVAYFDQSKSKNNDYISLRFPRLKQIREDKSTTSTY